MAALWTGSEYSDAVVIHDGGIDGALHRSPFFFIFGDFLPLAPWQFSPRRQLYNPRKISSSLQVDGQKASPPSPLLPVPSGGELPIRKTCLLDWNGQHELKTATWQKS